MAVRANGQIKQTYAQVYSIVNAAAKLTLGTDAPTVMDGTTLVGLGSRILPYDALSINFIATLFARIGKTIIENKAYKSKLSFLMFNDFEWGGVVQIIETEMPDAVEDASLELEEGKSVDMYVVKKPKAKIKFYTKKDLYSFYITIQRKFLKDAFTSAAAMGAFLNSIETKVRNALELANENLGKITLSTLAGLTYDTPREIKLVTRCNAIKGTSIPTGRAALEHEEFLRFMSGQFQDISEQFTSINTIWNAEGRADFTNPEEQRIVIPSEVDIAMRTNLEWNARHEDKVALGQTHIIPHWQFGQEDSRMQVQIKVNKSLDDFNPQYEDVKIDYLVGMIFDREACGTFRTNHEVATTPYNARGRYTNTFWHEDNMWFNNLGKQHAILTLR